MQSISRASRASTSSAMGRSHVGFNMMRELCGALPDEVLLSRKPLADVRPYRRSLPRVPVQFDAEQTALVFHAGLLERPVPSADPRQRARLEAEVAKSYNLDQVLDQVEDGDAEPQQMTSISHASVSEGRPQMGRPPRPQPAAVQGHSRYLAKCRVDHNECS